MSSSTSKSRTGGRGGGGGFLASGRQGLVSFPPPTSSDGTTAANSSSITSPQTVIETHDSHVSHGHSHGHSEGQASSGMSPATKGHSHSHGHGHSHSHGHDNSSHRKVPPSYSSHEQVDSATLGFASSACVPWERYRQASTTTQMLKLVWSDARQERTTRTLSYYIVLLVVFNLLEMVYGWKSGSLALTTGAAHGVFHVFALCSSLMIMLFARASPTLEYTYGYERFEVLAAFSNTLLAIFMSLYLMFHSLHHIAHASEELTNMFVLEFGVLRLVINLIGAFIFRPLYQDPTGKDVESGKKSRFAGATDSVDGTAYGHSGRAAVFGNGEGGFGFGKNSKHHRFGRCYQVLNSLCELLGDMRTVILGRYHQGCLPIPFFMSQTSRSSTITQSAAGCANKMALNVFRSCRGTGISWEDVIDGSNVAKYPMARGDEDQSQIDASIGKRKQRQKVTHSLHVNAVYVHLVADTLASLAVTISGIVLRMNRFLVIDSIQGILICLFTMYLAIPLFVATSKILLQCVPPHLQQKTNRIHREILAVDGILDIVEAHYWSLSPGCTVGTMRILIQGNVDADIAQKRVCEILRPYLWFMTVEVERDTATDWLKDAALPEK